ncbi:tyrosine-type recombinase/integrase [Agrobacterium tumefaciens]|uniref:tyrosine-type recombinase/integrase n=1 Tax=Agrobacterium tumefaciens TaxID=358 RepID=UPI000EF1F88E|nr:tyrosine-type recombinase/integrase [Agrobacterium tumefaciens]AYM09096.1 integrase [Agrobacterium tumefaciens]NSZ36035.1 tyrosine-type recombinase/integrase [Agrobacterium tumefaciens]QLG25646.1 tyrosine-type recombinase/integrase [Agrobacterium tumefaciens]UXS89376.1 tyrosine-type recombinase/integrase [Agrobacterium tumefaciens]
MLSDEVHRYITLRRSLGYKLSKADRHLCGFARFADLRGEAHIRTPSVIAWLEAASRTPGGRGRRLRDVILFARFLHTEDPRHEIPGANLAQPRQHIRPAPYIYSADEIARILDAAGNLRLQKPNPLRREIYVMIFGLIAATGLRISEALALKLQDIQSDGVLYIRDTKFRKSRLVPLHASVGEALQRYLKVRRRRGGDSDWLFPSARHRKMCSRMVNYTFSCILRRAGIAPERRPQPRIHDLRHTFATQVLVQCGADRGVVARHFVALSTYLGHADVRNTYWYLEATPQMMTDIASAAETLVGEMRV